MSTLNECCILNSAIRLCPLRKNCNERIEYAYKPQPKYALSWWIWYTWTAWKCRWVWLNGVTETINGCIKAIARDGKGYSFEILRGKVLYVQAYKTKAIFSYNKFSPTIHYVTGPSNRSSLNMIQNLMDSYKQISGADIDRLKLGLF